MTHRALPGEGLGGWRSLVEPLLQGMQFFRYPYMWRYLEFRRMRRPPTVRAVSLPPIPVLPADVTGVPHGG